MLVFGAVSSKVMVKPGNTGLFFRVNKLVLLAGVALIFPLMTNPAIAETNIVTGSMPIPATKSGANGDGSQGDVSSFESTELRGIITSAIDHSDTYKISKTQIKIANTSIWRELAKFTPTINFSLDASSTGLGLRNVPDGTKTSEVTFSLSMPLFTSGQRFFSLNAARSNKLAAKYNAEGTRNDVIGQTISTYLQYKQTEKTVALLGQNVSSLQKLTDAVRARKKHGFASQADLSFVQANLANMRLQRRASISTLGELEAQLENLIGRKITDLPALPDFNQLSTQDENSLVAMAVSNNPAIKAAKHSADAQKQTSYATVGKYLPQVNLYGQYDIPTNTYSRETQTTDWQVGVRLTMPIVDLATVTEIAESRHQAQIASYQASDTRRNIELSIRTLTRQFEGGKERLRLAQSRVSHLSKVTNSERQKYDKGVGSLDQLLERKQTLAQARIDAIRVKIETYWAGYQLAIATGDFDPSELSF